MDKSKISLVKHTFFNNKLETYDISFKDDDFSLEELQTEFSTLYQLFLSNKQYWLNDGYPMAYMRYLCDLMIRYYQKDYVSADLQKLAQYQIEIESFKKKGSNENRELTKSLFSIETMMPKGASPFLSLSELRKYIGNLNSKRAQFSYSRVLANHAIAYLQKSSVSQLIHEINVFIGNQYSFMEGINFLNQSRATITALGIALSALRFAIHFILIIKHIVLAATNEELSIKKVFKHEIEKRGFMMINDLVWTTVSLLTTYNHFFHIATSFVAPIIVIFLTFDTLLLLAQWLFETNKYNSHLQELNLQKKDATLDEQALIQRQIDVLNDEWDVQCAHFAFNILGANILAISFALSMICTGPLALAGMAFFSMLGNALYNSSEEYKKYQKAQIAVQRELSNGKKVNDEYHEKLLKVLNEKCDQSCMQFWKTLSFNTGGIAFLITAAVASWPIALSLALTYVAYQLFDAYQVKLDNKSKQDIP
ncbi:MAG: hypothetical protein HYX60_05155, partial [Legionella longbeachae]|nr:hypothetical protein [Legionella longbeachae]